MGHPRSLDIDLLRSFLLIADGVSFSRTAVGIETSRMRSCRALDFGPLEVRLEQADDLLGDPVLKIEHIF